jgi:hypothetical protein
VVVRPDIRQASVTPQEALARRSLFTGLAVVAYWIVEPLVAETLARLGLSGVADLLAFLIGLLGTIAFVAIFVVYLRHDGLADLRQRLSGALPVIVVAILLVILAVPVVRFASTWGTRAAAPVVPAGPTPTPGPGATPTPTPRSSAVGTPQSPGATAQTVASAADASNLFGGGQDRWDNVGEMWVLHDGKKVQLTIPDGWAATYVDPDGTAHGCPADGDWARGPQQVSATSAVLIPAVNASCSTG